MENLWYVVNVVFYDGCNAYVSKFIVKAEWVTEEIGGEAYPQLTNDSKRRIKEYLSGNGEVLKFDPLYSVKFDNIMAMKDYDEQPELQAAYNRFVEMYF